LQSIDYKNTYVLYIFIFYSLQRKKTKSFFKFGYMTWSKWVQNEQILYIQRVFIYDLNQMIICIVLPVDKITMYQTMAKPFL